jgi:hypothetical protein
MIVDMKCTSEQNRGAIDRAGGRGCAAGAGAGACGVAGADHRPAAGAGIASGSSSPDRGVSGGVGGQSSCVGEDAVLAAVSVRATATIVTGSARADDLDRWSCSCRGHRPRLERAGGGDDELTGGADRRPATRGEPESGAERREEAVHHSHSPHGLVTRSTFSVSEEPFQCR